MLSKLFVIIDSIYSRFYWSS